MKNYNEYLPNEIVSNIFNINRIISASKKVQAKSKEQKRLDNSINNLIKELKKLPKDPQAFFAMDSLCIISEKSTFANTEQDISRCNNQLMENMEAISAIELIKNKEEYLEKVRASGASINSLPKTDAFLNVVDKRIKYLGAAMNSIDASPTRKRCFLVRQENLRLAKKLYIELQKDALGLESKNKVQSFKR